jgi:hypothetical protein
MNLFNDIEKSKILLIGHDTRGEALKDWLINQIPHSVICPNSDIKSFLRNERLDNILNDEEFTNAILLNIMDLKMPLDNPNFFSRSQFIKEKFYSILDNINNRKLIIVTQIYKSPDGNDFNFNGRSSYLYMSDLNITIRNNEIKVIKNRHDNDNYVIKIDNYEDIKQKSIF